MSRTIKFLDLADQYHRIRSDIDAAIRGTLEDADFIGGKRVGKFERDFADFQDAAFCIGVGNGTDALEIAIEAMELPKDSEIVVPANSFIASSEAVTRSGCRVVFCDCDPKNYTISISSLKSKITTKTSAILAVHMYGHPCDMDPIIAIAEKHDLKIIEDCAQAHGATYKGKKLGAIGHVGAFSFYPGKNLGAYGDGGMISTNCPSIAKQARMIANHGRIEKYNHEFEGRNSRLDAIQASILSVKLKHLSDWTKKRNKIAKFYNDNIIENKRLILPTIEDWAYSAFHLYVISTPERDSLQEFLNENGIQTGIHYPISLPKLNAYRYLKQYNDAFFANDNDQNLLSLPVGDHLHETQTQFVASKVNEFFE